MADFHFYEIFKDYSISNIYYFCFSFIGSIGGYSFCLKALLLFFIECLPVRNELTAIMDLKYQCDRRHRYYLYVNLNYSFKLFYDGEA